MRSMTGFGRASIERDGTRVVVEIRALNQRFLELKLNLPRGWGEHESDLRKVIQAVVSRGRVEVFIRHVALKPAPTRLEVNEKLASMYVTELRKLGKRFGLAGNPSIDVILNRPEVFHVVEEEHDTSLALRLGLVAMRKALKSLDAERVREGKSLKREILKNFEARIRELLDTIPVNEKRLYEEASAASQHGDISEEITRLRTHLQGLKQIIGRPGPVGKSIEFLLQEINREVNTMGSKSQNAALSQLTVEVKAEAEKMREQVQNVE
jgi:uncharacterized protein YicC (UPF0701 family)